MKNKKKNMYREYRTTIGLLSVLVVSMFVGVVDTQAMLLKSGQALKTESHEIVYDDLYAVGEQLYLNGTTTEDVFALGSYIEAGGAIMKDALLLGGALSMKGSVAGDLRVISGKIDLTSPVSEDAVLIGGIVTIGSESVINGGLLVVADHLVVKGVVRGPVKIYARTIEIEGVLEQGAEIRAMESLSILGSAKISGALAYTAPRSAFISETTDVSGPVTYTEQHIDTATSDAGKVAVALWVVLMIVTVLAITRLFPYQTRIIADYTLEDGVGFRALKGLLLFLGVPVAIVLLLVSIFGAFIALLVLFTYLLVCLFALLFAPVVLSVAFVRWFRRGREEELHWLWVSFGVIVFSLIGLVPAVGWAVKMFIFLLAYAAILQFFFEGVWKKRAAVPYTQPTHSDENTEYTTEKTSESEDSSR